MSRSIAWRHIFHSLGGIDGELQSQEFLDQKYNRWKEAGGHLILESADDGYLIVYKVRVNQESILDIFNRLDEVST
jgi:hypothetical protein